MGKSEWTDDQNLTAWCSTQAVSGLPGEFGEGLGIPASNVRVLCQYMGGGFGSKFNVDRWGVECANLAKEAKAPVHWMLDREAEMTVAGDRPSAFAEIEVGAKRDGTIVYWGSKSWGSGGLAGSARRPLRVHEDRKAVTHQRVSVPTHGRRPRLARA
jgi:xanthine dehydrogenase YagR molybdenum-binding subunit